jgi:RHS repeat-associated protein
VIPYTWTFGVVNSYFGGKLLANGTGNVVQDRLGSVGKYYPWGQEKPSATTNGTEKFTGYFRDSETGLDYAQNRYHQPGMGRFLTMDQANARPGEPATWNRYAYAGGDPANNVDPSGMYTQAQCEQNPQSCQGPPPGSGPWNCAGDYDYYDPNCQTQNCPASFAEEFFGNVNADPSADCSSGTMDPTKTYRTYFLTVMPGTDCYLVPSNRGPVTREITYQLDFQDNTMSTPMFTNTGVIWEHLTGNIPSSGPNSPSSAAPGTFPDQQSIAGVGTGNQSVIQTFTAIVNGTSIGLAIDASQFGGWVQSLNIQKYAGYVSINGNIGGKTDPKTGKLIPGTYTPCNN